LIPSLLQADCMQSSSLNSEMSVQTVSERLYIYTKEMMMIWKTRKNRMR